MPLSKFPWTPFIKIYSITGTAMMGTRNYSRKMKLPKTRRPLGWQLTSSMPSARWWSLRVEMGVVVSADETRRPMRSPIPPAVVALFHRGELLHIINIPDKTITRRPRIIAVPSPHSGPTKQPVFSRKSSRKREMWSNNLARAGHLRYWRGQGGGGFIPRSD